jgi:large subunit ribosomal protein L22
MERQVSEQGFKKKQPNANPQANAPQKTVKQEKKEDKSKSIEPEKTIKPEDKNKTSNLPQTKPVEKVIIKKEFAIVQGKDLPISYKTSGAICRFIKNKNPEKAMELLELVKTQRMSIPVRGEAAHKRDQKKGYARGKYPEKASKYFIKLLKSLIANAKTNNLDTEKIIITIAKADKASNPIRGTRLSLGRKKFKRAHIFMKVEEKKDKNKAQIETKAHKPKIKHTENKK